MHAWLCENPVGVDALTWKELPTPAPKAGEVLIEIKAASLNFPDLLIVQNKYQMKPALPFVPGSEYAGVVAAVGEGVTHLKVGQNVACLSGTGGFGTLDELMEALTLVQTGKTRKMPIILVCEPFWRGLLDEARREGAIADDVDMDLLQEALSGRFAAVMLKWVMGGGSVRELEPAAWRDAETLALAARVGGEGGFDGPEHELMRGHISARQLQLGAPGPQDVEGAARLAGAARTAQPEPAAGLGG